MDGHGPKVALPTLPYPQVRGESEFRPGPLSRHSPGELTSTNGRGPDPEPGARLDLLSCDGACENERTIRATGTMQRDGPPDRDDPSGDRLEQRGRPVGAGPGAGRGR